MPQQYDRRTFLGLIVGSLSASAALPLLSACSAPASTPAAPAATQAPAQVSSATKVSYAYASPNGLHYVATVGSEKPDLPHKFGVEFDLLTTTNSPNAVNALVGGSVDLAAATPDSAWPA